MNRKLLIVTDLGLLRAYERSTTPRGTPRLELLEEVRLNDAHQRVTDKVTDFAGRRGAPTRADWGAPMADDHNLRLETKRRLIKQLAGHIQRLMERHPDQGVWLAAPREINYVVLDALPKRLRPRLEVNLARDLVKAGKAELIESFPRPELAVKIAPPVGGRLAR